MFSASPPKPPSKPRRNAPHPTARKRPCETLRPFARESRAFFVSGRRCRDRPKANLRKFRGYSSDCQNQKYEGISGGFMAGGPGFEPRLTESESAPTEAVVGVLRCPIVTIMAEYATASGSAEMVTPKNRLAGGEAPLLCRQHGIPQGPVRADARRSTGRSPQRVIGTTPLTLACAHPILRGRAFPTINRISAATVGSTRAAFSSLISLSTTWLAWSITSPPRMVLLIELLETNKSSRIEFKPSVVANTAIACPQNEPKVATSPILRSSESQGAA
jgi:hypothetical protein